MAYAPRSQYLIRPDGTKYRRPVCHRDGTFSYWSLMVGTWFRHVNSMILLDWEDLPRDEKDRIIKAMQKNQKEVKR